MFKHKSHGTSKKHAIRSALGQLGWHAKGKDVVAFLANFGVKVNEGLVSTVKIESTKRPEGFKRHEANVKSTNKQRKRSILRKTPQQREHRR